ncbi:MAG: hypothetical protein R2854_08150 [Caldilineaceae bacterium]
MEPIRQTYRWKPDWPDTAAFDPLVARRGHGALSLHRRRGDRSCPRALTDAATPADAERWWTDPAVRRARAERIMSRRRYFAEGFPIFDTQIGPGSLGLFLGATPVFDANTVWYQPCIDDPDRHRPIRFAPTATTGGTSIWP